MIEISRRAPAAAVTGTAINKPHKKEPVNSVRVAQK